MLNQSTTQADPYAAVMSKYNYTPSPTGAPVTTGAADWDAFKNKQGKYAAPTEQPNIAQETGSNYTDQVSPATQDVMGGGNIKKAADLISKAQHEDAFNGGLKDTAMGLEHATLGVGADTVQALFAPITAPIQTLLSHANSTNAATQAERAANGQVQSPGAVTPETTDAHQQISDWASKLAVAHPDLVQTLKDAFTVGTAALGSEGLNTTVSDVAQGVKDTVTGAVDTAKTAVTDTKNAVADLKNNVTGKIAGKDPADILATPEDQVHKLSAPERKYYFDNQKDAIGADYQAKTEAAAQKYADTEAKVKTNLQTTSETLQKEAEDLNRQVGVSSRDEVLALRPKIQAALGRQSQQYRTLVDEELAPHVNVPVSDSELGSFVDSKFAADPAKAAAIKDKLGITAPDSTPGVAPTPSPTRTLGDIYKQSTTLGQDIGTAVKKGTRVFNPDEVMTDNAISTLTDFMQSKGVDLSAARTFWAKYAPVRNQLVTEAKPFLQAPTQTKTFANTITRVAKGTDVNNENFISSVEDLVGQPIGKETRAALQKLSENEKQALAAKIDSETQLAEAKLLKEQESNAASTAKDAAAKALEDKQFNIEKLARNRTIVRSIVRKLVGAGIGATVGASFGGTPGETVGAIVGGAL